MGITNATSSSIEFTREGKNTLGALLHLATAVYAESPSWTRTPPTASGVYWWRWPQTDDEGRPLPCVPEMVDFHEAGGMRRVCEADSGLPFEKWEKYEGAEWWPIPIEPPKETQ